MNYDLEKAVSKLSQQRTIYAGKKRHLERLQGIQRASQGAVSEEEMDAAQIALDVAHEDVRIAEIELDKMRGAQP